MSFNKISLFSFILITNCSHIIAMESTEQSPDTIIAIKSSIKDNLKQLHLSILNCSERLHLARIQKKKNKEIYENYIAQAEKYIADETRYKYIIQADEVYNYEGGVYHDHYTLESHIITGSKDQCKNLKKLLSEREITYGQFANNLQRVETYVDMEPQKTTIYLKDVNARLQEYLAATTEEEKRFIYQYR